MSNDSRASIQKRPHWAQFDRFGANDVINFKNQGVSETPKKADVICGQPPTIIVQVLIKFFSNWVVGKNPHFTFSNWPKRWHFSFQFFLRLPLSLYIFVVESGRHIGEILSVKVRLEERVKMAMS